MKYKLIKDYCENPGNRHLLTDFAIQIFNLDLTRWIQNGFWDENYKPISFLENDKIVSNVSVYSLQMIMNGQMKRASQFSTVGTLPEYRREGLGKKLIQEAIEFCREDHDFIFLYANDEAVSFYQKQNFLFQKEYKYFVELKAIRQKRGIIKLEMSNLDNLQKVYEFARDRKPVSNKIGILSEKLLMYHALYPVSDFIFFIPELELILIFERKENKLIIYDIIGKEIPKFSDIFPYISNNENTIIEFQFMPDKLGSMNFKTREFTDNQLHIYELSPFKNEKIIFPFTSQA